MSFLKDAGSIALDAVLTDAGRKRMAQGKFKVAKFAIGDDEMDYSILGVWDEAEGDREPNDPNSNSTFDRKSSMTQTPELEALAETNANINYGLLTFGRTDLFYLPILKTNEQQDSSARKSLGPVLGDIYYLSVNEETTKKLRSALPGKRYVLETNDVSNIRIMFESGLETDNLERTAPYRQAYILQTNTLDTSFYVYCDGRFIENLWGPPPSAVFANDVEDDGKSRVDFGILEHSVATSLPTILPTFNVYILRGINNLVYQTVNGQDREVSSISGPRGTAGAIAFSVVGNLKTRSEGTADPKYTVYGTLSKELFSDGNLYDYIDTTVYVEGRASSARIQMPIRIIRYSGTS
jgi:hypothetical protein